jgi:hypothetical protein
MDRIFRNLIIGNRYFIYEKTPFRENEIIFRANIFAIYEKCIIVNYSENAESNITKITIPREWIIKKLSLRDITNNNFCLPPDVLDIIDKFI